MDSQTEIKSKPQAMVQQNSDIMVVPEETEKQLVDKVTELQAELRQSPEVTKIAKDLDVHDSSAILEFGSAPAQEISKFADKILHSMKSTSVADSGVMLKELGGLMTKFDKKDFEKQDEGFFGKIFSNSKKAMEKLISKYETVGGEIDKIYVEITKYKNEINNTNLTLEEMYKQNLEYYKMLEKYIVAGQLILEELRNEDLPYFEKKAESGDQMDLINLDNVRTCIDMIEQRITDMEMAKMVSLQTAPQIRLIEKSNYKLISKIHSAFVITIPVFKNGLIQAVALKRQKLIADSMESLDNATNEMLLKNAQNIKSQSVDIAKLSGSSSVKIETLEQTWNTIMEGIEETRQIEDENRKLREESVAKIHDMQNKMIESAQKNK